MTERDSWRCAVLRGWDHEQAQPLTPIAAVAWSDGATLSQMHVRWVPSITQDEILAEELWRRRLFTSPDDLDVNTFLQRYADSDASSVLLCAVPEDETGPDSVAAVADGLLDDILESPMWDEWNDMWTSDSDESVEQAQGV